MKDSTATREFNELAQNALRSGCIEATPEITAWIERNPESMSIPWIAEIVRSMGSTELADLARRSRSDNANYTLSGLADKRAQAPLTNFEAPATQFPPLARAAFANSRIQLNEPLAAWMRDHAAFLAEPRTRSCIEKMGSPELARLSDQILSEQRESRFAQTLGKTSPDIAAALESGSMAERAAAHRELDRKIFLAVIRSNPSAVDAAIAQGADIDAKDNGGSTPLHQAIERFDSKMVSLLLARGAKLSSVDSSGLAPLQLAVKLKAIHASSSRLLAHTDPEDGMAAPEAATDASAFQTLSTIVELLSAAASNS